MELPTLNVERGQAYSMAAVDLFNRVIRELTEQERQTMSGFIAAAREALLAARSEDASLRLAEEFAKNVHDIARQSRH